MKKTKQNKDTLPDLSGVGLSAAQASLGREPAQKSNEVNQTAGEATLLARSATSEPKAVKQPNAEQRAHKTPQRGDKSPFKNGLYHQATLWPLLRTSPPAMDES